MMYTPVPWEVVIEGEAGEQSDFFETAGEELSAVILGPKGHGVTRPNDGQDDQLVLADVDIEGLATSIGYEEAIANVYLMAAAPTLLEACESALAWIDRLAEQGTVIEGMANRAIALRSAVAKAKPAA